MAYTYRGTCVCGEKNVAHSRNYSPAQAHVYGRKHRAGLVRMAAKRSRQMAAEQAAHKSALEQVVIRASLRRAR